MVLLRLYTGRSDIAVGSPLAGRNRGDIEGLIGLFVNPVVFRVQANVDLRFTEFMAVVRDAVWEALANQDVPFERVLDERRRRGEHNADPFYTINFICQTQYARASTLVHEFCESLAAPASGFTSETSSLNVFDAATICDNSPSTSSNVVRSISCRSSKF